MKWAALSLKQKINQRNERIISNWSIPQVKECSYTICNKWKEIETCPMTKARYIIHTTRLHPGPWIMMALTIQLQHKSQWSGVGYNHNDICRLLMQTTNLSFQGENRLEKSACPALLLIWSYIWRSSSEISCAVKSFNFCHKIFTPSILLRQHQNKCYFMLTCIPISVCFDLVAWHP